MKRILFLLGVTLVLFNMNSVGFATEKSENRSGDIIYISNEDEINQEMLSKGYIYVMQENLETRVVCYNCGKLGLTLQTVTVQEKFDYHVCPMFGPSLGSSDLVF